jgi:hypothetical protein
MRVEVSREAAVHVLDAGGALWVWAAYPKHCCSAVPAYMHAATRMPAIDLPFQQVPHPDLEIWFRAPVGREPEVLEVGMRGRRHPKVEAYWDGCLLAM